MRPLKTFQVRPALPDRLVALEALAYNIRWSWDHETISLFRNLDHDLWETSGHNPVLMLGSISQARLQELEQDEAFLARLDRTARDLEDYLQRRNAWYHKRFGQTPERVVAYFSMEFGLTDCLPIYSGGLGMLAGDHLKSASELGLPLVGVGLLYQKGYFRQYLSAEGWQQERYPVNDFHTMPVRPFRDAAGQPVRITVELGGRPTLAQLWYVEVGRITLVLLDTNVPENPRELQDVTDELYGGDLDMRVKQEVLLGVGGMRALDALGLRARVYHMNEGHSAFVSLERIRRLMKERGISLAVAREIVTASTVFTTHTPVPAGIDVFPPDLVERHLGGMRAELGLAREELLDLGRVRPGDQTEPFNMAVAAIRLAGFINGVSRLHMQVSRRMWQVLWPNAPVDELPIGHVTNGVHPGSWISDEMRYLYERYLGPRWAEEPGDTRVWQRVHEIPGEELWRTHERRRERLVAFTRRRLAAQLRQRGAGQAEVAQAGEVLDPEALTIGFGRRFASYKRATLLLRDPERLARILNAPGRPVQVIFAGKAHPKDDPGKSLIREIVRLAERPEFRRRIVFLEDYDTVSARYLVQGCDVWLNTPRRPREASGTSGMKAAFNGVLNLSILDGWWDEAFTENAGWAIGRGEEMADNDYQDRVEAGALYELIEHEVAPLFYTRGSDGLPRGWIALMKTAMQELCPVFNTNRMVCEYVTSAYMPALQRREKLEADGHRRAIALAAWRDRVRAAWRRVRINRVEADIPSDLRVGEAFVVHAWVQPGELTVDELAVQVFLGRVDEHGEIVVRAAIPMAVAGPAEAAGVPFAAQVPCKGSGMQGLTVRVLPFHEDVGHPHETRLIIWAT
ncbi:MAG: alpha-glucan family phosphorylase [Acidobacteria bacterium]|nr:alpha-glucan family phosphorylase [Acidobacteriota bacterium]